MTPGSFPSAKLWGWSRGHLRPFDGTTLSCLFFWKPNLQSTVNQIPHIPVVVFLSLLNLSPWLYVVKVAFCEPPYFREWEALQLCLRDSSLKSKVKQNYNHLQNTYRKKKDNFNQRKGLVPFNSTFIVPLLVLDFCAFFLSPSLKQLKSSLITAVSFFLLLSDILVGSLSNGLKSHSTGGRGAEPSLLTSNPCPFPRRPAWEPSSTLNKRLE